MATKTNPETVRRVQIWSWILRLTHAAIALSGLILLLSGWLLGSGLVLNDRLHQLLLDDLHLPAGYLLAVALVARLFLLVSDDGVGGFKAMLPDRRWPSRALEMIRFYASFGRTPLPGYFAHNALWAPLYLVFLLLAVLATASGLMLDLAALRGLFGWSSDAVLRFHASLLEPLGIWMLAHVLTSLLHDVRGSGADVSAMLNGYRVFEVNDTGESNAVPGIRPQDIGLWRPEDRK